MAWRWYKIRGVYLAAKKLALVRQWTIVLPSERTVQQYDQCPGESSTCAYTH